MTFAGTSSFMYLCLYRDPANTQLEELVECCKNTLRTHAHF